jgi:hypothetical protein
MAVYCARMKALIGENGQPESDGDDTAPIPKRRKKAISAARPPLAPIDTNMCHNNARLIVDNVRKGKAEMVNDSAPNPKRLYRDHAPLCPTEPSICQLIGECPHRFKRRSKGTIYPSAKEKRNKVTLCAAAAAPRGHYATTCAAVVPSLLRLIVENDFVPFTQASVGSPIDSDAETRDDIIVEDDDLMDETYVDEDDFCGNGRL